MVELEIADSFWRRMKGLLGRRSLPDGTGLLIPGCSSIHTAFMKFSIDVVYLDSNMNVCGLREHMEPFSMSSCPPARMTLELPAGDAARYEIVSGEPLSFEP